MPRRLAIVVLLLAVAAETSGTAAAASWTSNGTAAGTAFTATAPATKVTINTTPSVGFSCSISARQGVFYGPGPNALAVKAMDWAWQFSTCTAAGWTFNVSCPANRLSTFATSQVGVMVALTVRASSSPVCTITLPPLPGCTILLTPSGGVGTTVSNEIYDSAGKTTLQASGQALTFSWTAACTIFPTSPGSAPGTVTSPSGGSLVSTITSSPWWKISVF